MCFSAVRQMWQRCSWHNPGLFPCHSVCKLSQRWHSVLMYASTHEWVQTLQKTGSMNLDSQSMQYLSAMLCISVVLAIGQYPSVCLSHFCIVFKCLRISWQPHHSSFFKPSGVTQFHGEHYVAGEELHRDKVKKIHNFRPISYCILETVSDRTMVALWKC